MKGISWNAEYRRWTGEPTGVWTRRLAIARYGLRLCLSGKVMRGFLLLAFAQTFLFSGVFFFLGQVVASDSALINWIRSLGADPVVKAIDIAAGWALLYPEVFVDGVYRIAYYLATFANPYLSLVAVALFVHRLIANDMASQAIVIYSSKALTRWDYIIGKFFVVSSILSVIWILPILLSWFFGNLLAPDWSFFYHTFPSLVRGLAIGVTAVVSLSLVAMLVSSLAKKTGAAVTYWVLGLLVMNMISNAIDKVYPLISYFDPLKALQVLAAGIYRIPDLVVDAQATLPFFGSVFREVTDEVESGRSPLSNGAVLAPLAMLILVSAVSLWLVNRRVRPQ